MTSFGIGHPGGSAGGGAVTALTTLAGAWAAALNAPVNIAILESISEFLIIFRTLLLISVFTRIRIFTNP
jgi:hypothetical protein